MKTAKAVYLGAKLQMQTAKAVYLGAKLQMETAKAVYLGAKLQMQTAKAEQKLQMQTAKAVYLGAKLQMQTAKAVYLEAKLQMQTAKAAYLGAKLQMQTGDDPFCPKYIVSIGAYPPIVCLVLSELLTNHRLQDLISQRECSQKNSENAEMFNGGFKVEFCKFRTQFRSQIQEKKRPEFASASRISFINWGCRTGLSGIRKQEIFLNPKLDPPPSRVLD
ncbi:hypothetical protein Pst134EA_032662 [Puccinia striiformis f. sp. tritici]|uniref:uncharacterized protein n=1 Tax=Puccinia striiformis f. sp. tritici TaxID=168172 RepID=UPI002008027F|nr:uncharacterized protein Pst134EA_032662 [Puccinia striiformis f. sp. tritici]KAH9443472.1 hypothetical protein Pst134EA_032662 [Puccinia striiformis f. sp. tritici]